jgi:nitroimidazol reductase NimA-like FMN-containing flavoprotein (pyridoxamine 5'-phosphate oxidase superfamily)
MWLGMMDGSLKALDLRRDSRLAVHSATVDKEVKEGDARVSGRAEELFDGDARRAAYVEHLREHSEFDPDAGDPFHVFRIDVSEVMFLRPAGDHLDIRTWHEGGEVRTIARH